MEKAIQQFERWEFEWRMFISLIFADEPTANLESMQGWQIITLLKSFARERRACVVVASQDLRFSDLADRIVPLRDGRIDPPEKY